MAVLGALKSWEVDLSRHRVVLFTDSEAVRGSFLGSWSANKDSDRLMDVIFDIESRFEVPVWIERVPSQSNPADILSKRAEVDPGKGGAYSGKSAKGIVTPRSPKTGEKARLWGKCHRHFLIFKKRLLLALLLQF